MIEAKILIGNGTIGINTGVQHRDNVIKATYVSFEELPFKVDIGETIDTREYEASTNIKILFVDLKGFDVVIEALEKAKAEFKKFKGKTFDEFKIDKSNNFITKE